MAAAPTERPETWPSARSSRRRVGAPPSKPAADREPAVVHEPVQRFVELPPEPRPAARPAPRPIVVDDDLDVPDFLK